MSRVFVGGNPDKLSYSHLSGLDGATQVAVACWIYPTATGLLNFASPWHQVGAPGSGSGSTSGICVYHNNADPTTIYVECRNAEASTQFWSGRLTADTWNHLLVQYDGSEGTATDRVRVYVNGTNYARDGGSGTVPTTLGTNNQPFVLGGATASGSTNPWTGRLAGVVVWTGVVLDSTARSALASGTLTGIQEGSRIFYDGLWDGSTPTNLITSDAATVTGTTQTTDPSGMEGPPSAGGQPLGKRLGGIIHAGGATPLGYRRW